MKDSDFCVVIVVADEEPTQLDFCLSNVRRCHPTVKIHVISDGVVNPAFPIVCRRHKADFTQGEYLKRIECGGAWWRRTLEIGLSYKTRWILKIDPDTEFHRPFRTTPPGEIAGTIDHGDHPVKANVLGGCQAIRAQFARDILEAKLPESPTLRRHDGFCPDHAYMKTWVPTGFFGTDASMAWMCRQLGVTLQEWHEVNIGYTAVPQKSGDFAVTHPRKIDTGKPYHHVHLQVITTCKGRLSHLKQTLPRWLAEPKVSVIVVDYACPERTGDWVQKHHPEATVVRVKGVQGFHLAHARNLGATAARDGWLCFFDADLKCHAGWSQAVRDSLRPRRYHVANPLQTSMTGSVVVHSADFRKAGGYDEAIRGWAAEDIDFYARLRHIGIRPGFWPGQYAEPIVHDHAARVVHYSAARESTQRLYDEYYRLKCAWMLRERRLPGWEDCLELFRRARHNTNQVDVPAPPLYPPDLPDIVIEPGVIPPPPVSPVPDVEPTPDRRVYPRPPEDVAVGDDGTPRRFVSPYPPSDSRVRPDRPVLPDEPIRPGNPGDPEIRPNPALPLGPGHPQPTGPVNPRVGPGNPGNPETPVFPGQPGGPGVPYVPGGFVDRPGIGTSDPGRPWTNPGEIPSRPGNGSTNPIDSGKRSGLVTIALILRTTMPLRFSGDELVAVCERYAREIRGFWPGDLPRVLLTEEILPGCPALLVVDDVAQDQALGYPSRTPDGQPIAKVLVRSAVVRNVPITINLTHELGELMVDPFDNLVAVDQHGRLHAKEICDPVAGDTFELDGHVVSNFVTPAWFVPGNPGNQRLDWCGLVRRPFEVRPGGISRVLDQGRWLPVGGPEGSPGRPVLRDEIDPRSEQARVIQTHANTVYRPLPG
jgi:hypothetical protein